MQTVDARLTSRIYRDTKERICALLPSADHPSWAISVPACPGWTIRDVVAHMTAVAEDWADGTLSEAPTDEQTAEHVARFADRNTEQLLEAWTAATARLQRMAATDGLSPPLGDIAPTTSTISAAPSTAPELANPPRYGTPPIGSSRCCSRRGPCASPSRMVSIGAAPPRTRNRTHHHPIRGTMLADQATQPRSARRHELDG